MKNVHCQRCGVELPGGSLKYLVTIHVTADFDGEPWRPGNVQPEALLLNGKLVRYTVRVDGALVRKPSEPIGEEARIEASELIALVARGARTWSEVRELASLVAGNAPPEPGGGLSIFKSLGCAIEDLAAASMIYDRAIEAGFSRRVGGCGRIAALIATRE